jgi:hypothetical protein
VVTISFSERPAAFIFVKNDPYPTLKGRAAKAVLMIIHARAMEFGIPWY